MGPFASVLFGKFWPDSCNERPDMLLRFRRAQLICLTLLLLPDSFALGVPSQLQLDEPRLAHARELLGRSFKRKVTRNSRTPPLEIEVSDFVMETTQAFLPKDKRGLSENVGYAILNAAEEFSLDPVFLMAVIQNESSFDPAMRGLAGEIGLMQILPRTAEWITGLYQIDYENEKNLLDPVKNVWIGAALLHKLRRQFDSEGRLYVSAYNMGPKKLRKLIGLKKNPKIYVLAVMKRYLALYKGFKAKGDLKMLSQKAKSNVLQITN
ncbi:MAG: lytic transglycosylase domain-containing protein [Bdellovibrionales bacterium]|nr:lytic transglycosylase domain-containing protein [Bdellovibrionales bacterium]